MWPQVPAALFVCCARNVCTLRNCEHSFCLQSVLTRVWFQVDAKAKAAARWAAEAAYASTMARVQEESSHESLLMRGGARLCPNDTESGKKKEGTRPVPMSW